MKKLIFLLILIFSVQVFANDKIYSTETKADNKEIQVNLYYKIYIIENVVQSEYQEKKSNSIFEGVDVDKLLRDAFNGTGKYSKEAKLATEMCEKDEKLMQGYYRIFSKEELEQIVKESTDKTNKALKTK